MKTEKIYEMEEMMYEEIENMSYDERVDYYSYYRLVRGKRYNDSYNEYTENETYYN